jgi:enediyne biosynthesis protein E4
MMSIVIGACLLAAANPVNMVDIAEASGLKVTNTYGGASHKDFIYETTGNGVAIFDYDGDGRNDIFIANGTTIDRDPKAQVRRAQLYHNEGNGKFTEVGAQAGFTEEGWAQGVCVGDYDNDARPDLFVTYYGHNRLYRNAGGGKFEDVTEKVKLPLTGARFGSGCSFFDYDRDGRLDLFVANYVDFDPAHTPKPGEPGGCNWKGINVMCGPQGLPLAHNILYHANADGTFTDVSEKAGILKPGGRYGLGVAVADFDNDGWPDIYVACDMTPSLFYHNRGDGTFEERGVESGVAYNFDGRLQAGMGVAVGDYDGNGFLDIAKTNFSGDLTSLYANEDGHFFSDRSSEAGLAARQYLGWGVAFVDVDEDGWKDLICANGHVYPEVTGTSVGDEYLQPTLLYRNLGNGRFRDITREAGPALQTPRAARGLATGDLDGDGRQEIVIVNMNQKPSLLRNLTPRQHFLVVRVAGMKSNRSGIGARISIQAGKRRMIDEIMSGGSFYSQNELAAFFGLGATATIDTIEIRWPSGLTQKWTDIPADNQVLATEGSATLGFRR